MDKQNLTRFLIDDMQKELSCNLVSPGRHKEIINFYKKHLKDDKYYCLSPYNPARPNNLTYACGERTRTFKCGYGSPSQYFVASTIEIDGKTIPAVIQKIYPKTTWEFYRIDKEIVVYLSKNDVDKLIEEN